MSDPFHHYIHRSNNQWVKRKQRMLTRTEHNIQQALQILNQNNSKPKQPNKRNWKSKRIRYVWKAWRMKTYVTTIVTKPESLFLRWMFWAATVQQNLSSNVSLPRKYLQPSLKRHPPSRAKPSSSAAPGISLAAPLKSTFLFSVTPLGSSLKLQTLSKKKPHKSSLSPQKDLCSPRLSPNDPNKSSHLL